MPIPDHEALEIIKGFKNHIYKTEAEQNKRLLQLMQTYPNISQLLFWDNRDLTPEQLLDEAKKLDKPIIL